MKVGELWGILEEVKMLEEIRLKRLIIQMDSSEAHKAIMSEHQETNIGTTLVQQIHQELRKLVEY